MYEIADALTSHLNAGSYSQAVTADRQYVPAFDLKDLVDLKVTVTPRQVATGRLDRSKQQAEYRVEILIQKRVATVAPADVDPMMQLTEEIADRALAHHGTHTNPAFQFSCQQVEVAPAFAVEHLDEFRLFTALLVAVYSLWRAQP